MASIWDNAWSAITNQASSALGIAKGKHETEAAIVSVLDSILSKQSVETTFNVVMLANNSASMGKNIHGEYAVNRNKATGALLDMIQTKVTGPLAATGVGQLINKGNALAMQALAQPNIAGVPISSSKVETNREIEVSESMVIIQSEAMKQYWTDNSVPRLKEWIVEGYLTSTSPLDTGHIIKPTLQWQAYYLDVCAKSRRPVIFKTNRGEFVKVQITNLHTVEEASYNNSIQVSLTLREYNPYFINKVNGDTEMAIRSGAA